jgi:hypothetical protein
MAGLAAVALLTVTGVAPARAKVLAAYLQGHGGLSSPESEAGYAAPVAAGVGMQGGARFLIFEAYGDRTSFGAGTGVTRGIFGLRGAASWGDFRLVLRGGGGMIAEQGGALTGRFAGTPDRSGAVLRGGIALESHIAPTLLGGFSIDGEVFDLAPSGGAGPYGERIRGSDVFLSVHLKFEIGI